MATQNMFCHRCGNKLPEGSIFCNRCGAKVQIAEERVRKLSVSVSPPRPSRRHPVIESRPVPKPVEEEDEQEYVEEDEEQFNSMGERIIFRINPAFYPVAMSYLLSTICSALFAAAVAFLRGQFTLVLGFAIVFFIPAIIKHIRYLRTVWTLTPTKLEFETGLFSRTSRNIPLRHIQDVSVNETLKERLIGIGDIIIDTAASESTIRMDNIYDPRKYADIILNQLHSWD